MQRYHSDETIIVFACSHKIKPSVSSAQEKQMINATE